MKPKSKGHVAGRIVHEARAIATPILLAHAQEHGDQYGVISVVSIAVAPDYSYIDCVVSSEHLPEELPKFFAPVASEIRREMSRQLSLRKAPIIRFRTGTGDIDRVSNIIDSIARQYHLRDASDDTEENS